MGRVETGVRLRKGVVWSQVRQEGDWVPKALEACVILDEANCFSDAVFSLSLK